MGGAAIFPVQRISGLTKQSSHFFDSAPRLFRPLMVQNREKNNRILFYSARAFLAKGVTLGKSEQERTDWNQFGRRPNAKKELPHDGWEFESAQTRVGPKIQARRRSEPSDLGKITTL